MRQSGVVVVALFLFACGQSSTPKPQGEPKPADEKPVPVAKGENVEPVAPPEKPAACPECKPCPDVKATAEQPIPIKERMLVGTWNVTLTAEYSTCDTTSTGDVRQRQWLIGEEKYSYKLKVIGGDNEASAYEGNGEHPEVISAHDTPGEPQRVKFVATDKAGAGMLVWLTSKDTMKGYRIVGNPGCAIMFAIAGSKDR